MVSKVADTFGLIIIGGIAIRIVTNKNSAQTISTIFHGVAEDISASFGK